MELVHRIQSHHSLSSAQAEEGKERRACAYSVITVSCTTAKPSVESGIKGRVGNHSAHLDAPFSNIPMPGGLGLFRNRNNCTLNCGQHTQILLEPSSHWVGRREQSADHPCWKWLQTSALTSPVQSKGSWMITGWVDTSVVRRET